MSAEDRLARAEELNRRMEGIRTELETSDEPSIELLEQLAELAKAVHEELEQAKKEADVAQS